MSSKPVYVPPHKRKRFHGAFTGGFSAGYFNTVGTKDGWKPSDARVITQSSQDFMDDQDHNEWGGPTSVKEEFTSRKDDDDRVPAKSLSSLDWIEPPRNVGTRLMRILGWREGSTAYVPTEQGTGNSSTGGAEKEDASSLEASVLSQKRLRKIQLQQMRVKMPPPKLDSCGLGFDAYRDAPEFQAHKEKRRREAQQRAIAATAGSKSSNAYRMSSLKENDDDESRQHQPANATSEADDPYLSYETMMDFVGTKTTGGFAMREDDDDVYDEKPLPKNVSSLQVDKDQYDTEIFEHESDDETMDHRREKNLGGILSSWATGEASKPVDRGITSDGRPPLPGFCLGGAITQKEMKRYAGPELPVNYTVKRHHFKEDEHPANFQKVAHQEKVEQQQRRQKTAISRSNTAMAGGAFSGLQAAMKNRFTSAAPVKVEEVAPTPVGLYRPVAAKKTDHSPVERQQSGKKTIEIQRTFLIFHPDPLVCKRLGVTQPTHSKNPVQLPKRSTEASFFEEHVVKEAAAAKLVAPTAKPSTDLVLRDDGKIEPKETDSRPAMNVYKSIFEPKSESEPEEEEEMDQEVKTEREVVSNETQKQLAPIASNALVPVQNELIETKEHNEGGERRSKKRSKKKKRKDRKRHRRRGSSPSSSETDLDAPDSEDEYSRSRRKDKKKRKRRKRASRSPSHSSSESDLDKLSSDEEQRRQHRKDRKRRKQKMEKKSRKSS